MKGDYRFASEYLDWMIEREARRAHVPGVAIAIVDGERIVWSRGYGWADEQRHLRATPDTLFHAGSVSKVLTAMEVLRLVDRGELALDDEITRLLPDFAIRSRFPDAEPISVRALLSHHSGLPSDRLNGMWTSRPVDLKTLERQLADDSLVAPPRTKYNYSNLDYSLLGRVIERKREEPFEAAMAHDVLAPAGMRHSSFAATECDAVGHVNGKELPAVALRDTPAGALVSSANDLARFIELVLAGGRTAKGAELVHAETLHRMFEAQFPGLPLDFGYRVGLGWMLDGVHVPGAGPIVWHNGEYPGYYAHLAIAPQSEIGVVVLANDSAASAFAGKLGAKAIALALEAKRGTALPDRETTTAGPDAVELPARALDQRTGDYVILGELSHIGRSGGHLVAEVRALDHSFDLVPISADTFVPEVSAWLGLAHFRVPGLSVRFTAVSARRFALLRGFPQPLAFERVTPRPLPAAWVRRLGRYRPLRIDGALNVRNVRLELDGGVLVADVTADSDAFGLHDQHAHVALDPIGDSEAVVVGAGNGEGGVVRALRTDGQERLFYSGFTFVRVSGS